MSYDVFFRGFSLGAASTGGGERMRAVLEPWVVHRADELSYLQIEIGDGRADLYLDDDDMLVNRVTGDDPWDLLVLGAVAAGWVVMPTGRRACLCGQARRADLPVELRDEAVRVSTGADLVAVLVGSGDG